MTFDRSRRIGIQYHVSLHPLRSVSRSRRFEGCKNCMLIYVPLDVKLFGCFFLVGSTQTSSPKGILAKPIISFQPKVWLLFMGWKRSVQNFIGKQFIWFFEQRAHTNRTRWVDANVNGNPRDKNKILKFDAMATAKRAGAIHCSVLCSDL